MPNGFIINYEYFNFNATNSVTTSKVHFTIIVSNLHFIINSNSQFDAKIVDFSFLPSHFINVIVNFVVNSKQQIIA